MDAPQKLSKLTTGQIASLIAFHKLQRDRKMTDRVKAIVIFGKGWVSFHGVCVLNREIAI
jgi:hypothetical protein